VHAEAEAQKFYGQLREPVLIGMEATGNSQWFVEAGWPALSRRLYRLGCPILAAQFAAGWGS